jgi:Putative DNA-binding domain
MQLGLADLQKLLCRLITSPNGVQEGLAAETGLPPDGIGAIIRGDAHLSAVERLDIYANMYFYRLLDAIEEDFPATKVALGDVNFHNLITGYVLEYPPNHPSITEASRYLAEFAARSPLLDKFPYLYDLIRLERAQVEVFLAPECEALDRTLLTEIPVDDWASLRIAAHPASQLLDCGWRVDEVLSAVQRGQSVAAPTRQAASILVWRKHCAVSYRALDATEAAALEVVRPGERFEVVCEAIAARCGEGAPVLISGMLSRWLADGVLVKG